ncbi:MAG: hypothetical protein EOO56_05935 [Hymenobacter sp.]|nr:MAG: hypothetical protein EOO56_05935 [Hymenobacter sp.]
MSRFSFSSSASLGRASAAKGWHHGHQASQVEVEFVFLPTTDEALGGSPSPRHTRAVAQP